ncbi:hypothetical protein LUW75_16600 [Streptomyces sp. MRC013]|uniref:hypothetical protein n=1 Tax=Streptomyces sp. MRC013 TaxID=2898276 RepID=UPI0020270772|nr:hypothetical protein [Streptomyces sp. MRC013]URM91328.1 hypothetical protein LUW75_16600 [Streptomyces sp. MRC013]
MNTNDAGPVPPHRPLPARSLRVASLVCGIGLPPLWLSAWLVPLSGERGGRCLVYGETCGGGWPEGTLPFCFTAVAVACCVVLFTPDRGARTALVRRCALGAQLLFSGLALLWVLTWPA